MLMPRLSAKRPDHYLTKLLTEAHIMPLSITSHANFAH